MRKVDLSFLDFLLVPGQAGLPTSSANHQPTTASQQPLSNALLSSSPPAGAPAMFGATSVGGKGSPTYFEALYTKEGFGRLKEWFCSFASGTDQKNEDESNNESDTVVVNEETDSLPDNYLNERQFVCLLSSICECNDNEALEIFDIFSKSTRPSTPPQIPAHPSFSQVGKQEGWSLCNCSCCSLYLQPVNRRT